MGHVEYEERGQADGNKRETKRKTRKQRDTKKREKKERKEEERAKGIGTRQKVNQGSGERLEGKRRGEGIGGTTERVNQGEWGGNKIRIFI